MLQKFLKKFVREKEKKSFMGSSLSSILQSPLANIDTYYHLYRKKTDLKRCVGEKQDTVGKSGYMLIDQNDQKIEENSLVYQESKKILENMKEVMWVAIRDIDIAGNAYIVAVYDGMDRVAGLQVLDPRTVRIKADKYGVITRYEQRVSGEVIVFDPSDVFHMRAEEDPDCSIIGLSRVESILYDVLSEDEAMKSNYAYFRNRFMPEAIVQVEEGADEELIKAQIKKLRADNTGGINAHRQAFVSNITGIIELSKPMASMEFEVLRRFTTEKICTAMSVPKTLLGYSDQVNYSTSDNQYRKFIENTIRPMEQDFAEIFSKILQRRFKQNIRFIFLDHHLIDRNEKIDQAIKLVGSGLYTIDEAREHIGVEPYGDVGVSDTPIIHNGFVRLEDVGVDPITNDVAGTKKNT